MTRRDAIKAGLGGLFATLLNWPTTNRIDMLQFCGRHSYRYDVTKPFEQGGFAYATDMKICVRTNHLEDATEAGDVRFPPAFKLAWDGKGWNDKGFITLPRCEPVAWEGGPCYECEQEVRCKCIDGCWDCAWSGYLDRRCPKCKDDKPLSAVMVHGAKMDIQQYRKLMTLPGAEVKRVAGVLSPSNVSSHFKPAPEYLVRFNGGQAVMLGIAERA